jgi:hypothetical protein
MTPFEQGFYDELENIQKAGWLQLAGWVVPAVGMAGHDVYKATKEQAVAGERPEEVKAKSYLTKYPTVGLVPGMQVAPWGVGKGLEALGRRGDTRLHKALSTGAGALGAWQQMDPAVALQKGLGL